MSVHQLRFFLFLLIALPCALSDWRTGLCPRLPLLALIVLMASTSLFEDYPFIAFAQSLLGSGAGMASFIAVRKLTRGGLGLADVWMAGSIGAFGGPAFCLSATAAAIALAIPVAIALDLVTAGADKRRRSDAPDRAVRKRPLPFLPVLVLGCILCVFFSVF